MRIDDDKIASLREKVNAARQEFDMAVTFHEVWKPAAFDEELHKRMGKCYAANAFFVVRTALRREMLLGLMRLWDNPKDSRPVAMGSIAKILGDEDVIAALAADRAARRLPDSEEILSDDPRSPPVRANSRRFATPGQNRAGQ